ncbi:hypothetical protein Tco_1443813 [Tanacetum coccineum]
MRPSRLALSAPLSSKQDSNIIKSLRWKLVHVILGKHASVSHGGPSSPQAGKQRVEEAIWVSLDGGDNDDEGDGGDEGNSGGEGKGEGDSGGEGDGDGGGDGERVLLRGGAEISLAIAASIEGLEPIVTHFPSSDPPRKDPPQRDLPLRTPLGQPHEGPPPKAQSLCNGGASTTGKAVSSASESDKMM